MRKHSSAIGFDRIYIYPIMRKAFSQEIGPSRPFYSHLSLFEKWAEIQFIGSILQFALTHDASWHATNHSIWRHIPRHHSTCHNDGTFAYSNTGKQDCPHPNPGMVPDYNGP